MFSKNLSKKFVKNAFNVSSNNSKSNSNKMGPSIISADLVLNGNIVSGGEVQIEGTLEGDIRAVSVIVGEDATVNGEIIAEDVVIRGRALGQIRGVKVILANGSRVEGNIIHEALTIEMGAYFDGQSRNSDNPLTYCLNEQEKQPSNKNYSYDDGAIDSLEEIEQVVYQDSLEDIADEIIEQDVSKNKDENVKTGT